MSKDHGLKQATCPYCKTTFWQAADPSVPMTPLQQRAVEIISRLSTHEKIANDYLDRLWEAGTVALLAQIQGAFSEVKDLRLDAVRDELMALMPPRTDAPAPDDNEAPHV